MLRALCEIVGITWDPAMLSWPSGGHTDDGAWAPHWYGAAHRSTGFDGPEGDLPEVGEGYAALVEAALPYYEALRPKALVV